MTASQRALSHRSTFVRTLRSAPGAPSFRGSSTEVPEASKATFPFNLPVLEGLPLHFEAPMTFLVGENGTGKSTILEALAVASKCVAVGSADLSRDPTLEPARLLAGELTLVRGPTRPRTALFFRAEDAFGFVKRIHADQRALRDLEEEFRESFEDGSYAQRLATGTVAGQRQALENKYGNDPDAASHGESFLQLLEGRLVPQGLYLLDEPETPLSPLRILGLLKLLMDAVAAGSQFVIATHSPILMAFPDAQILDFSGGGIESVEYDDVEHVRLTRAFLRDPSAYLRRLSD